MTAETKKMTKPVVSWLSSVPEMAIPVLAVFTALAIGAIIIWASGANVIKAYQGLLEGAVGSVSAITETLVIATPYTLAGLAVALAECAFHGERKTGCEIEMGGGLRDDALLFGESQSRVLVTCKRPDLARLLKMAAARGVPAMAIGRTGGDAVAITREGREVLRVPVERAFRVWKDSLPGFFRVRT